VIFKVLLDRPKDWVDIQHVIAERPIDADYIERWLLHLRGQTIWPRIRRLLDVVSETRP
jgi:hypothetical protein